jgi:signal recognition particle GTPase
MKYGLFILLVVPLFFVLSCASPGDPKVSKTVTTTTKETKTVVKETTSHTYLPRFTALKEKTVQIVIVDKREGPEKNNEQAFGLREKLEETLTTAGFEVQKDCKSKMVVTLTEDLDKNFCLKLLGQLKSQKVNLQAETSACSSISSASGQLVAGHSAPALNLALNNLLKLLDQKSDESDRTGKISTETSSL